MQQLGWSIRIKMDYLTRSDTLIVVFFILKQLYLKEKGRQPYSDVIKRLVQSLLITKVSTRHVEMPDNNSTTANVSTTSSFSSTTLPTISNTNVDFTTTLTTVTTTNAPTITHNGTTVTSTTTPDDNIWDEYGTIIISITCVIIVLLLIFIISLALFSKWKSKRRTEGTYNPSRAENHQYVKNKVIFSIPLPTPERLI